MARMLSMDFDTSGRANCYFRVLVRESVKYIVVAPGALDADALDNMPLDFMDIIPQIPYDDSNWSIAHISRDPETGELQSSLSQAPLKGVTRTWHPELIDLMELERVNSLTALTQECTWRRDSPRFCDPSTVMIAKMARFEWEIPYIENETRAYALLEGTGFSPRFLGHILEQGRVIGILLEKVEGRHAGIGDMETCRTALKRLHSRGIMHGDCNRHNFIVGSDGRVTLVDFEKSKSGASEEDMEAELAGLDAELREDTGRGGGFALKEDETQTD
ncbi:alpha-galactosidase A [Xylaria palmicola]|nr:alpha-galactosidase A [Xylaria palmicola]